MAISDSSLLLIGFKTKYISESLLICPKQEVDNKMNRKDSKYLNDGIIPCIGFNPIGHD